MSREKERQRYIDRVRHIQKRRDKEIYMERDRERQRETERVIYRATEETGRETDKDRDT